MTAQPTSPPPFETLAIHGVGLLGGSLALAARRRGLVRRVLGLGRDAARLEAAHQAGVIDVATTDPADLASADLIVICTPVDRIAADVLTAARCAGPQAVITDVGSTKAAIVATVQADPDAARKYVPAHPLAGSEQRGFEAASAHLFESRLCVLTPVSQTDPARLERIERFWRDLGMRTVQLTPEDHDAILAVTSHLPHVAAAALVRMLTDRERPFTATGFRDTTRIAGGDAMLWTAILLQNAGALRHALGRLTADLQTLATALARQDAAAVEAWLEAARRSRAELAE